MTLKELRKSKGMTQAEAAKICGKHVSNYKAAEKGNTSTQFYFSFLKTVFEICDTKEMALLYVQRLGDELRNEL